MDLGFETIGNACLILHDRGPVLATDPWLVGSAYFGSWITAHEIPEEQMAHVAACKYLWISHGHPDHLSLESLKSLKDKRILLPDHYGGRVARDLREMGFDVTVLKDGEWTQLSDRVRVVSVADFCQDAILLADVGGRLIINSNDASDHGGLPFVAQTVARYPENFLMCLTGYGDADMINFFDESGARIEPPAMKREPFLDHLEFQMDRVGIRSFVPFSSLHKYQRTDSAWANACVAPLDAYRGSFRSPNRDLLPPYCSYNFARDEVSEIAPAPRPDTLVAPEEFGDNWSEELTSEDIPLLREYFGRLSHLKTFLGFVNFKVGGRDNVIDVAREQFERGITFEVPRGSLMTAIRYRIFDDILIGNFVKTTLHGPWHAQGTQALYPDFIPFVTKFGDNGGAYSADELRAYFAAYQSRGFFGFSPTSEGEAEGQAIRPYLPGSDVEITSA